MQVALSKSAENPRKTSVFALQNKAEYQSWRENKLAGYPASWNESIVTVADLANPTRAEVEKITDFCTRTNMAIYESAMPILPRTLKTFCQRFGMISTEGHRSAGDHGVVAIERTGKGGKSGYIPYTDKPLSWHTDGYYNIPQDQIRGMVLHCVRDASEGGVNQLLDPEIAYIRMRDEDPAMIEAFMHSEAMIIPANDDPRSAYRPDSVGPVFSVDETGALNMRYSARSRNVVWRNDKATDKARDFLREVLESDPLIVRHKLKSGQGIISNNVLHNRSGFTDAGDKDSTRLLYRIRYRERVGQL